MVGSGHGHRPAVDTVIFRPDQTSLPEVSSKTARSANFHRRNLATASKAISVATFSVLRPLFPKIKPRYEISGLDSMAGNESETVVCFPGKTWVVP
jgi:hypothetical protein